jgi:hypothetical protein
VEGEKPPHPFHLFVVEPRMGRKSCGRTKEAEQHNAGRGSEIDGGPHYSITREKGGSSMSKYALNLDFSSYDGLNNLALLAHREYNLGNEGDWFGEFRGGLYGFYSRLDGVTRHFAQAHDGVPSGKIYAECEYHLASIFFHMDSALECLAFAINALGWAVDPDGFRNVTDAKAIRQISSLDILGKTKPPRTGYPKIFPTVQKTWLSREELIVQVRDLHDVSKHRKTIVLGGQGKSVPPNNLVRMAEIPLKDTPKLPSVQRRCRVNAKGELLENLVPEFAAFINTTGSAAIRDAQANIKLKPKE